MIHNLNADEFSSLYPKFRAVGRRSSPWGQRREIKKVARSRPVSRPALLYVELVEAGRVPWSLRGVLGGHQPRGLTDSVAAGCGLHRYLQN